MDKIELLKRLGDISQICDVKRVQSMGGLDDGVKYIHVYTGSGLNFDIIESRGLDITNASYKSHNLSYITKNKVTSPYLFEEMNEGFRKSFFAGLLTTCGLTYNGTASNDNGRYLGTHGRYSVTPAEDVNITKEWIKDDFILTISGIIRETRLFGENILLKRVIQTKLFSKEISITDEIINQSFNKVPLMLLYHFNFGYPLLDEASNFTKSTSTIRARDIYASKGLDSFSTFSKPIPNFREQVFYHENFKESNCFGEIFNPIINLGVKISFLKEELPMLIQWKMISEGDYVLGIEPATNPPEGYASEKEKDNIQYLSPFEKKIIHLNITILEK